MRKIVFAVFAIGMMCTAAMAQDSTLRKILPNKKEAPSNDHFFIQYGYLTWTGKPDSIKTKGLPHTLNIYVMLNFPFKTDPHWSVALGPGISSDNMIFDKMIVGIKESTPAVRFHDVSDTSHYKKYKLSTNYFEAPVELRYRFNPDNDRRSVKLAVGAKVGFLINAHTKGKTFESASNQTIGDYTVKELSKQFFSKQRLSVMGRVGYGPLTLYVSYSVTSVFKEGVGPAVHPLSIGLTLSAL
jgi:hypothetical protein